jgi:hypothetical protein
MHAVNTEDIERIKKNVEDCVGTLMVLQDGNFNDAEKMRLFITCARVLGRVVMWASTLPNYQLQYFVWRCSFGFVFDVNTSIEYLILYGCTILDEIEFYSQRLAQQSLIEATIEEAEEEVTLGEF